MRMNTREKGVFITFQTDISLIERYSSPNANFETHQNNTIHIPIDLAKSGMFSTASALDVNKNTENVLIRYNIYCFHVVREDGRHSSSS